MLKGRFENLKNLSRTMPAESDFFKANPDRIAVPLTGPGKSLYRTAYAQLSCFNSQGTALYSTFAQKAMRFEASR